nr:unnamed protein product [Callosobruchus chinensis]CAH7723640.1 unnamed protein product [Callosobruchus chinensis]CAH7723807.1 unnamed protein product [Callosobruchus chinensis]CAH7724225.1 unnamed protein product [Callosobruchus chinensis]CAH7724231.1 unnamed protein product [Callosobruchus chinensis]
MNTENGSIKISLRWRRDFQGSGVQACWRSTAGFWDEIAVLQGIKESKHQIMVHIFIIYNCF